MSIALPGPTTMSHQPGSSACVVLRDVRIARKGVANQHGVVASGIQPAVGLVGHGHLRQALAEFQFQRFVKRDVLGILQRPSMPKRIAAFKKVGSMISYNAV